MKVALEVSTIGLAGIRRNSGYNRTGIFRFASEFVESLIIIKELNVFLVFWEYPYTSGFGQKYFKDNLLNI